MSKSPDYISEQNKDCNMSRTRMMSQIIVQSTFLSVNCMFCYCFLEKMFSSEVIRQELKFDCTVCAIDCTCQVVMQRCSLYKLWSIHSLQTWNHPPQNNGKERNDLCTKLAGQLVSNLSTFWWALHLLNFGLNLCNF